MDRTFALQQYGPEVQAAIDKIIALTTATTDEDGLLSAEDKAKLDALGISYNTTSYWGQHSSYVPAAGEIVIYSDHATVLVNNVPVNVPGIKVGNGTATVSALAFSDDYLTQQLAAHAGNTEIHVTTQNKDAWNAKYDKPGTGIPKTDLEAGVQTSLGKADNAAPQATTYTKTEVDAAVGAINAKIPSQASSENQLADKAFVNSSISTETATYRGSFNLVSDLGLTIAATQAQIATALAGAISTADNNDYCFVQVPTADATPTEIARVDRYKYNGTAWAFEFSLNNSGFTAAQWAALNSGITSGLVTKLSALPTNADLQAALGLKADKSEMGVSVSGDKTTITLKSGTSAEVINQHQDISGKQDVIDDLSTIRSNAAAGKAASDALGGKTASDILNEAAAQAPKTEQKADQEIVFRKPNVTWDARAAFLKKLKGKTLAWNQLFDFPAETAFTIEAGANYPAIAAQTSQYNVISGHKYYTRVTISPTSGDMPSALYFVWKQMGDYSIAPGVGKILEPDGDTTILANTGSLRVNSSSAQAGTGKVSVSLIDLTLLFGAGNEPTTVAEFETMFPEPYYPYNAGELISNDASALETVGFNQWDEEWQNGYYDVNGVRQIESNQICTKNFIPVIAGKTYYFKAREVVQANGNICYYDADKGFIIRIDSSATFTIPAGASYIQMSFGAGYGRTYNNDICINLSDASRNGQYEPYRKSVLPLNLDKIKVKSPNIWDEEWELGEIDNSGAFIPDSSHIRTKNYTSIEQSKYYVIAPSTIAIRYYDSNKGYIGVEYVNDSREITPPSNARYFAFTTVGTTYPNNICINKSDPAFNGRYFPHGVLTLEGGLKSAGTVKDEIVGGKYVKRMGILDLSTTTLPWIYDSTYKYWRSITDVGIKNTAPSAVANIKHGEYIAVSNNNLLATPNSISINGTAIEINNGDGGPQPSGFMVFELANEEVYELVEPIVGEYMVDKDGTERAIAPLHTSDSPSAPLCADVQYGITPADSAVDAANMLKRWEYIQAQIDELNNA